MAHGFKNYSPANELVNLSMLGNNCYFCTVAALSGMDTHKLSANAEEMQDDFVKDVAYILGLFKSAGHGNVQYWGDTNVQQVEQKINSLGLDVLREAVGLAYSRNDGSGHMVVLYRALGGFKCLDYQSNFNLVSGISDPSLPQRYLPFPPENNLVAYHVFYTN